ncbi:MAG: TetR family transcriptional regulator [Rhizobiales bacterium]|nr:TetR family transcriptional regulator [Hyphomicrobiales bacterium]
MENESDERRSAPLAATAKRAARDPERTRLAILDAATQEFAQNGFGGARVDAVAARAGSNKRMIYHYFGNKENLYLAVLDETYRGIRVAERQLQLGDLPPEEAMASLVQFTWNYFIAHPEFISLLNTENLMQAKFLKRSDRIRDLHSPLVDMLGDLLERGASAGVFRGGVDPVQLYVSIAALGFFYLSNRWTLSTIFGRDLGSGASLKERGEHIVSMVLGYLSPAEQDAQRKSRYGRAMG